MTLLAVTLAHLLNACAPNIGRRTMTAIVRVESGGNPLLIRDNTLDRTFVPHDARQGSVWAHQLLALRHSVDLGISQINDANLPRLGMTVREAFDPCINIHGGATILASDYRAAATEFGAGQYALRRAIGAYNSGSLYAGYGYTAKIVAAAGLQADDDFRVPELQSIALPAAALRPRPRYARDQRAPAPRRAAASGPNPYTAPIMIAAPTGSPAAGSPERAPLLPAVPQAPTPVALPYTTPVALPYATPIVLPSPVASTAPH